MNDLEIIMTAKITQLEVLQSRIVVHGNRLWQLPLTYLGVIAISLSAVTDETLSAPLSFVFIVLSVMGFLVLWCQIGAYEGYKRTAENMHTLEKELNLGEFTKSPTSHTWPYILLPVLGILSCIVGAIHYV